VEKVGYGTMLKHI